MPPSEKGNFNGGGGREVNFSGGGGTGERNTPPPPKKEKKNLQNGGLCFQVLIGVLGGLLLFITLFWLSRWENPLICISTIIFAY